MNYRKSSGYGSDMYINTQCVATTRSVVARRCLQEVPRPEKSFDAQWF